MDIAGYLHSVGLKATPIRLQLVEILYSSERPLDQKDIESQLSNSIDRVTLYRNLKILTKKNIIHKIEVNESVITYNITKSTGRISEFEEHPHFHCDICNKVYCLPAVPVEKLNLPVGFEQKAQKIIIDGTCKNCNKTVS